MVKNQKVYVDEILKGMYKDSYYPDFLVDKCKDIFIRMCETIEEENPQNLEELYKITQSSTEEINELESEFNENGSEIETIAREYLAEEFYKLAEAYGFEPDIEELIATRDW